MESSKIEKPEYVKPSKTRLIWGVIIFISSFLSPMFIPFVISSGLSSGYKSLLSGLLAFGIPEVTMLIAVGIMGKDGFSYLKRFLAIMLRRYGPPDTVSEARYKLGLILFSLPIFIAFLLPYFLNILPFISKYYITISLCVDIFLVLSLFILGGDFWDKLRGLFISGAKINFKQISENEKNH